MKDLILAGALLLAVIAAGTAGMLYSGAVSEEIGTELEAARAEVRAQDWAGAQARTGAVRERWEACRGWLSFISQDCDLAAVDLSLSRIESLLEEENAWELERELAHVALLIGDLHERERLCLRNLS